MDLMIQVRELVESEWHQFRDIRLEALKLHWDSFSPSRDEFAFSETDWRARIRGINGAMFGLFFEGELMGISTVIREDNQPSASRAHLVGSYIRAEYRGRGYSRLLYNARIAWAQKQGDIETLYVEAHEENTASHCAHRRFGFSFVEAKDNVQPDGRVFRSLVYALDLGQ